MSSQARWCDPRASALLLVLLLLPGWAVLPLAAAAEATSVDPGEVESQLAVARGRQRFELLSEVVKARLKDDPQQAASRAKEALAVTQALGDPAAEASAHFLVAEAARALGHSAEALEHYELARRQFEQVSDTREVARATRRLGDVRYFIGDYETALRHYLVALRSFEALAASEPSGPPRDQATLHIAHLQATIGNVVRANRDYVAATEYYAAALAIYERHQFRPGIAGAQYNLGLIEQDSGRFATALARYEQARSSALDLGDDYLLSLALSSAGSALIRLGRLDEALARVKEALALCERTQRQPGVLSNLLRLAEVKTEQRRHPDALADLTRALELARTLGDRQLEAEIFRLRARNLEESGDPVEALANYREYARLHEELLGAEQRKRVDELRIGHETSRKEQTIALLEAQSRVERLRLVSVIGILVIACLLLLLVIGRIRLRARAANEIAARNRALEDAYARVEELSRTDVLTTLANRRALLARLELERQSHGRSGGELALLLIDIDGFKRFNDTHGHDCGDVVLRAVADVLKAGVRERDAVGRWGGEEFLVVLPDTAAVGAVGVAEKIRERVAGLAVDWQGQPLGITVTVGVSAGSSDRLDEILKLADVALLCGKAAGKDRVELAVPCSAEQAGSSENVR